MTREEILQKSQNENRGRDVAEIEASKNAMRLGWILVVCLAAIAAVIDGIVFGRVAMEILFAVLAASAAVFFCKYAKLRKTHELIVAICYSVGALCFLAGWVMQLAGSL